MNHKNAILFFAFFGLVCTLAVRNPLPYVTNHLFYSPYCSRQADASSVLYHSPWFDGFRSDLLPFFTNHLMRNPSNQQPYVAHEAIGGLYTLAEIKIKYKPKNVYVSDPRILDLCFKGTDVAKLAFEFWPAADLAMRCQLLALFMDKRRKTVAYRFMGDVDMHEPCFYENMQQVVSIAYNTFADSVSLVMNMPNGRVTPCEMLMESIAEHDRQLGALKVHLDDFVLIAPDRERFYSYTAKEEGQL